MNASCQESYDKPRQYVENRDSSLLTKVRIVKAMVVVFGCENWTVK